MTDRSVFDHGPVNPNPKLLGQVFECEACGLRGETVNVFDVHDCPPQ